MSDAADVAQAFRPADFFALALDAPRGGDAETLGQAIDAGVPVNATTPRGDSLLMLACYYDHIDAGVLLDHGAHVISRTGGDSPVHSGDMGNSFGANGFSIGSSRHVSSSK